VGHGNHPSSSLSQHYLHVICTSLQHFSFFEVLRNLGFFLFISPP
jgi:hypothetical protein